MKYKNILTSKTTLKGMVIAIIVLVGSYMALNQQAIKQKNIVVYKDPNCGCCTAWIKHLERNNFNVEVHNQKNMVSIKTKMLVPDHLQSCHTASIEGYTIEGHVPADLIDRLLVEKPKVVGLAVPGMPMGSPGMEGSHKVNYAVLAFQQSGEITVYANR